MIYVSYSADKPMQSRLLVAQETIDAAFKDADGAVEFARHISETKNPEFWRNARRIELKQNPLIVFAVRYHIESDLPIYEISWNPKFEPEVGVALSDDWQEEQVQVEHLPDNDETIYVKRLGAQLYAQAA